MLMLMTQGMVSLSSYTHNTIPGQNLKWPKCKDTKSWLKVQMHILLPKIHRTRILPKIHVK